MSIKNSNSGGENRIPNPCKVYLNWSGEKGHFSFYDKETASDVVVDTENFQFILLDRRCQVVGWDDVREHRYYSNSVKSTVKEELVVRSKDGVQVAKGFYKDIKNEIDIKYQENLFCYATLDSETWLPVQINLSASSLGVWSSFVEECGNIFKVYDGVVSISGIKDNKKGRIEWITPELDFNEFSDDSQKDEAITVYEEVFEPYFKQFETPEPVTA